MRVCLFYVSIPIPHCSQWKRAQREKQIQSLPSIFRDPLTSTDKEVLSIPLSSLVEKVQSNEIQPGYVLIAYGKAAIKAHKDTNCLTEIMIDEAFSKWVYSADKTGPLAGVPISLKDVSAILRASLLN
jgi:hypothetical protein